MATRTTSGAVQRILLADYKDGDSLDGFIETASVIVDDVVSCADALGVTLSTAKKELMERWVAAHLYTKDRIVEEQAGDARTRYQEQSGRDYPTTSYLENAIGLDTSGCLKKHVSKKKVYGYWLGKPPSSQTDYVDRD